MEDTNNLLFQGIAALKAGQKAQACELLKQSVQQDERNEKAWLWLSGAVDTSEERLFCMAKILSINPNSSVAKYGLQLLTSSSDDLGPDASNPESLFAYMLMRETSPCIYITGKAGTGKSYLLRYFTYSSLISSGQSIVNLCVFMSGVSANSAHKNKLD